MARKRTESKNEKNMPRKRYTPGLGRDLIAPGRATKAMGKQQCSTRGCENDAIVSRRRANSHTYIHLCTVCAGYEKGDT